MVIGGHFGDGDHFDGGDHFGGGTLFYRASKILPFAHNHNYIRFEEKCVLSIRELPRSFASGSFTATAIT